MSRRRAARFGWASVFVAVITALLAIWQHDSRWAWTAGVFVMLAFVYGMAADS